MMQQLGFQPFVLAHFGSVQGDVQFLVCQTQNEAEEFLQELAKTPTFMMSGLLRGFERAFRDETYEAAELFFRWGKEGTPGITENVEVGLPPASALSFYVGYPVLSIQRAANSDRPERRIKCLMAAFDAFASTTGNDALRLALVEALALALSRALGSAALFAQAAVFVDRGLESSPRSIHLKAAKQALALRLKGAAVPPRLEKFIGEDNRYLSRFVCPEPFKRFDIGPSGDVLVCCGHWLPKSIGNFLDTGVQDILNSPPAQAIRRSVADGSYNYCNHLECAAMIQEYLPTRQEVDDPVIENAIRADDFRMDSAGEVLFALDRSCNLACPSCRTEKIAEKESESQKKARAVEEKLLPLLPKLRALNINPAGEVFASRPSHRILEAINRETCPDLVLDIISNGTLLTEDEWAKFPGIHGAVNSIRISVDAARRETFEALRRLGHYEPFVENMRFLSRLRARGQIAELKFSFTYQLRNFREMPEFVPFALDHNCDFVIFERLQNLGTFSEESFRLNAVHLLGHALHGEFLETIRNPIFRDPHVWHDFDDGLGVPALERPQTRARFLRSTRRVRSS